MVGNPGWSEDDIGHVFGGVRPFLTLELLCSLGQEIPVSLCLSNFPEKLSSWIHFRVSQLEKLVAL